MDTSWKAIHGQSRPAETACRELLHVASGAARAPREALPPSHRGGRPLCASQTCGRRGSFAPAQSSKGAYSGVDCRKSDLPLLIPIRGHGDLPGISDRAVYAAFSATFWSSALSFFFPFCCRHSQPSTAARAWPYRLALLRRPARSSVARPSWASPCGGLLPPRPARAAARAWNVLAGSAAVPCSALRRGRR